MRVEDVVPGLAFLNLSEHEHLCFVATPRDENDEVVLLSVTTDRPHSDHTCELAAGAHSFITHASVIAYHAAVSKTASEVCARVKQGKIKEPISESLLRRALLGAVRSLQTPRGIKRMIRHAYHDL